MMKNRELILPERRRRVPQQFSWVDQRLVRDGYFGRLGTDALALYLFLLTVGNADGLSWYSDERLVRELGFDSGQLQRVRSELCRVGLLAWRHPLYQVLDLSPGAATEKPQRGARGPQASGNLEAASVGEILLEILKGGAK